MKEKMQVLFRPLALAILVAFAIVAPQIAKPAQAATVVVDTFNTTQTFKVDPGGSSGTQCVTDAGNIIGGSRFVAINLVSSPGAPNGTTVSANAGGLGQLGFSEDTQVTSTATLTYDGDCLAALNPTGLGGVDLTQAGSEYAIVVTEIAADLNTSLGIRVYTDATHCSILTQALTPLNSLVTSPRAILFTFTDFGTDPSCPNPANFANVGAVQLIMDGTANPGSDITIDLVQTSHMDFGDLPIGLDGAPNYSAIVMLPDGAAHVIVSGLRIGALEDDECDGQPTFNAYGDDSHHLFTTACIPADGTPATDDEDGVTGDGTNWAIPGAHSFTIVTTGTGCVSAWIDFDRNGNMISPTNNRVAINVAVTGTNTSTPINFTTPAGTTAGALYLRVRLFPRLDGGGCPSTVFPLPPDGQFAGGEVEDYRFLNGVPTGTSLSTFGAARNKESKVRLQWETATESNVIGFNVWRKPRKGEWVQVNAEQIVAQNPGSLTGSTYKFNDTKVPAKAFKYKLEVKLTGNSKEWSNVIKVKRK